MTWSTIITIAVIVVVFIILFMVFKWILRLLVLVAFLFIAYITNPGVEQHVAAVAEKAAKENVEIDAKKIAIDDYYVFSITQVINGDHSKTIGAGAFTQVVIFSE